MNFMHAFGRDLFRSSKRPRSEDSTPTVLFDKEPSFRSEIPDTVGEMTREIRAERGKMTDSAWIERILQKVDKEIVIPPGYVFHESLQKDLVDVPPQGMLTLRKEDGPPPPAFDKDRQLIIPKHVYIGGLVWTVGEQIGRGATSKVFEVTHSGDNSCVRLVKIMGVRSGEQNNVDRGNLWKEIGAMTALGDYIGNEIQTDDDGTIWMAELLERYEGTTLNTIFEPEEGGNQGEHTDTHQTYQLAIVLRSLVRDLRRMHEQGWIHGDMKPANAIANMNEGEESLSRIIDFGLAKKEGSIRRKKTRLLMGTPAYILPEEWSEKNVDLRIKDYWGAVVSLAETIGLVRREPVNNILSIGAKLAEGTFFRSPDLSTSEKVNAYCLANGIGEKQGLFLAWMYRFIQPSMDMNERREFWRQEGITQTLQLPSLREGDVELLPDESIFHVTEGDFLNDDKFVGELEDHIRQLAGEAQLDSPDAILAGMQEFPQTQTFDERITDTSNAA